jgi:thioredoxin-related protein
MEPEAMLRRLTLAAAALTASVSAGLAAELLMFEQAGCAWCARFNAEIAPAYANTEEGKRAPLRRVDINAPWPDDLAAVAPERFTPTFVVVDSGKEVARMRGYPGDEFFWFRLGEMLERLDQP